MPFGGPLFIPSIVGQNGNFLTTDGFALSWGTPGGGGTAYTTVANFASLPSAASQTGNIFVVLNSTGIYLINRKEAGMYYSNGVSWTRLGDIPSFFSSNNFQIYDGTDNTKVATFNTSNISTGTTRLYTLQDSDDTLIGRNTTDVLTNKTLTSPTINSPSGLVKGDVGLSNVENTALSTWAGSSNITTIGTLISGTVPVARISGNLPVTNLNSGTGASSSTFWRGDGTWAAASGVPVNIQSFTSSGTWTKPTGGQTVFSVFVIGGGGGGGSGRRGAAASDRRGGGGGGGGATAYILNQPLAGIASSVTITVGAGGTGGTAQTTDNTNGNAGTAGGQSTFGGAVTIFASGGGGGGAGTTTSGTGGSSGGTGLINGSSGGAATATNGSNGPNNNIGGCAGGGAGGSISAADVVGNGGGTGTSFLYSLGSSPSGNFFPGGGAAGGAAGLTGGTNGGTGSNFGGGGGGGGASLNGFNSGAGGNGGGGCVLVICW